MGHVLSAFVDDEEQTTKPTVSTLISEWMRADIDSAGCMRAGQEFLGVNFKVSQTLERNVELRNVKIRIINKFQYEPFLEENEKRISDIIQIYPKEFVFNPPAELVIKLPSCVGPQSCGQMVCIYCSNRWVRYSAKYLKWRLLDSHCFFVNVSRTEARIICKRSGLYTIKVTQQPQVITKLDPHTDGERELKECKGIQIKFPIGCVAKKMSVTLQTISSDELCSEPTPVALVSGYQTLDSWLPQCDFHLQDLNTRDMVDVTSSPVVLIRPSRYRFLRPVQLTLALLGNTFEDFFAREETRIVVMTSKVPDQETISWKYHYSTPEVKINESGFKVASFLITKGGLYKLVRRLANTETSFIKQISTSISREIPFNCSSNRRYFVSASLRGFMTEIAEPGKQFVLRIALFDSSQPANPDLCFVSEVCSQPLSLPLGLTRFLVRGSFEPDRDSPDHNEERIVMYTGKTLFVDFYLKLKLKDPTKLPDVIGKVSVHGAEEVQFYISLHKPTLVRVYFSMFR